ncbi:MAG: oligosaccharide flippase family protein [Candidatus Cloacimonetes bacterium]|nr:oligosaccharide flippase family protein [Candidatus Cloacimonadota bacterium]
MLSFPSDKSGGTVRTVQWTLLTLVMRRALVFCLFLVIARVLTPDALGIFREYTLILLALTLAAPVGLDYVHVTARSRHGRTFAALTGLSSLLALVFTVGLLALAGVIGRLAGSEELAAIIRWSAPILLVHVLRHDLKFDLRRRMRLRLLAAFETTNVFFYASLTLALLLIFHAPWTLFAGFFAGDILETALLLAERRRRYGRAFLPLGRMRTALRVWREHAGYCLSTSGTHLLGLWANQAPVFLLGVLFAPSWLGIYYLAQQMIGLPVTLLTQSLQNVFFPTFARMNDNEKAHAVKRVVFAAAGIMWPLLALYGYALWRLVPVLFGQRWAEALPLIAPLGALMASHLVMNPIASIPVALRRSHLELAWRIVSVALLSLALLFSARLGFAAAIRVYVVVQILMHAAFVAIILRLVRLSVPRMFGGLFLLALPPAALLAAGYMLHNLAWPPALATMLIVQLLLYGVVNLLTSGRLWHEMRAVLAVR